MDKKGDKKDPKAAAGKAPGQEAQKPEKKEEKKEETAEDRRLREEREEAKAEKKLHKKEHQKHMHEAHAAGGNIMDDLGKKQIFKKFSYRGNDLNKLIDILFSIILDNSKIPSIMLDIIVCLIIPNFMFSFLLSFIIDLYKLMLLTPILNIAGIKRIFCKNKPNKQKDILSFIPKLNVIADIVYPKQKPL